MKCFVCRCEDVTLREMEDAIERGYADLESMRRYTGIGTGPCQGKACLTEAITLLAQRTGQDPARVGAMTLRPPARPVPFGVMAAGLQMPHTREEPLPGPPDRAPIADRVKERQEQEAAARAKAGGPGETGAGAAAPERGAPGARRREGSA